jgi:hypothetical protein
VERCNREGSSHLAAAEPDPQGSSGADCTWDNPRYRSIPTNGAVYVEQSAIVLGVVRGRVTVASNADIIVPNNITYYDNLPESDYVLGLIAQDNVFVASYSPSVLNWRAATIAQTGEWRSYSGSGKTSMTFTGSTATNLGGSMGLFNTRTYNYDATLEYLSPPWFPVIEEAYTVQLFRELNA